MDTPCGRIGLNVLVLVTKVFSTENDNVLTQPPNTEEKIVLPLGLRLIGDLASLLNAQVQYHDLMY